MNDLSTRQKTFSALLSPSSRMQTLNSMNTIQLDDHQPIKWNFFKFKWTRNKKIALVATTLILIGAGLATYFALFKNNSVEIPIQISVGNDPVELKAGGFYSVPLSSSNQIYALYKKTADTTGLFDTPAGRSYDGRSWEPVFPLLKIFDCKTNFCLLRISKSEGDFVIVPSNATQFNDDQLVSDFLIQSTFGPTRSAIQNFPKGADFKDRAKLFLQEQMRVQPTLHRSYYRTFVNPLMISNTRAGRVRGPCEVGSRWERAAIDFYDSFRDLRIINQTLLYIDDEFRTEVPRSFLGNSNLSATYYPCVIRRSDIGAENAISSVMRPDVFKCLNAFVFRVPALNFTTKLPDNSQILHRNADFTSLDLEMPGVVLLQTVRSNCAVTSSSRNLYASDPQGIWYRYQPRLRLVRNTIDSPYIYDDFPVSETSFNVRPRKDFVNEEDCVIVYDANSQYQERCGSPGEIENNVKKGNQYFFMHNFAFLMTPEYTDLRQLNVHNLDHYEIGKGRVWANIAVFRRDQIRQRIAWALAQIFVVSSVNIFRTSETEFWLKYYDIFVRHAFGNYFDVMKEVSYSPAMGSMLTYIGSKSFQRTGIRPDENYAREIMQLFSIGLYKLHQNGTQVTDLAGNIMETYTTYEIQNFARVWTGFFQSDLRGNFEPHPTLNTIDPMKIVPIEHDSFPKNGLDGTHIGDGYPLCKNLPKLAFLKKGAKYRYLGMTNTPVINVRNALQLNVNSALYQNLCNLQIDGKCDLKSIVYLAQNLPCFGIECEVATIRTIELILNSWERVYYEYVQMPCVELEFPTEAITSVNFNKANSVCVDKDSVRASPICCPKTGNINTASLRTKYDGEISSFRQAEIRCAEQNQTMCRSGFTSNAIDARVWTSVACQVNVQVYTDGQISIAHSFNASMSGTQFAELRADSNIKFKVDWLNNDYPQFGSQCGGLCTIRSDSCLCPTKADIRVVYSSVEEIPLKSVILKDLKIGAVDPSVYYPGEYAVLYENKKDGVTVYVDSSKTLNANSIFQVVFAGSEVKFLANVYANVNIGDLYQFEILPNFIQHEERNVRDVEYEVDAVLKHLLYHQNTAPFVADQFIKRFVTSNPSPKYIEAVANAFTFGKYEDFGTGRYGDLAATIAATLLYNDALSAVVKSDTSHGKIREPILKVIHLMRSLELNLKFNREMDIYALNRYLGQEPYFAPSVFNYYLSKFQPNSAVKRTSLYAPEAQLLNLPRITSFLNAMYSIIEFGLTGCFDTVAMNFVPVNCGLLPRRLQSYNPDTVNSGSLTYNSSVLNAMNGEALIEYLNTLLTGGRLDFGRKKSFLDVFDNFNKSFSRMDALKVVLELFVSAPEYQVSTFARPKGQLRRQAEISQNVDIPIPGDEYRAVIYVYLSGGMDSYNLLVPHSKCGEFDMYQHYRSIRTGAALNNETLLPIDVPDWGTSQPCKKFGIIGSMPFLQEMYNSSEAAFFANIGPLVEPLTTADFNRKKRPVALYAHEMQTQHAMTLKADAYSSNGILGRIRDQVYAKKKKTSGFSLYGGYSNALEEALGKSDTQIILNPNSGIELVDKHRLSRANLHGLIMNLTSEVSESVISDTWNELISTGLAKASALRNIMESANLTVNFRASNNIHFNQMEHVSRLIASRSKTRSSADFFHFSMGGFDTHNSFTQFGINMGVLDSSLRALATELKNQGVWDKVTVVVASEFARTLRSNGLGTDHAWGGNTFIMGGSVKGGQIHGKYPSRLNDPTLHIGNGILIPTTPWESMWNGIAQWVGVPDQALDEVLPNRKNFNVDTLFTKDKLFK